MTAHCPTLVQLTKIKSLEFLQSLYLLVGTARFELATSSTPSNYISDIGLSSLIDAVILE
jgi:hypothetical protein